jgi:hypothetical protein
MGPLNKSQNQIADFLENCSDDFSYISVMYEKIFLNESAYAIL